MLLHHYIYFPCINQLCPLSMRWVRFINSCFQLIYMYAIDQICYNLIFRLHKLFEEENTGLCIVNFFAHNLILLFLVFSLLKVFKECGQSQKRDLNTNIHFWNSFIRRILNSILRIRNSSNWFWCYQDKIHKSSIPLIIYHIYDQSPYP